MTRFAYAFDPAFKLVDRAFGVTPDSCWVDVTDDRITARFGPWRVTSSIANVTGAGRTGPYAVPKTIGPAHLSFRDRGLTFATNARRGVCIQFRDPVRGIDPIGLLRHPALTVTVEDPDRLIDALASSGAQRTDVEERREEQAAEDELHTMTASELRALADERGLSHTSSMKKADLVALLEPQLIEEEA